MAKEPLKIQLDLDREARGYFNDQRKKHPPRSGTLMVDIVFEAHVPYGRRESTPSLSLIWRPHMWLTTTVGPRQWTPGIQGENP